MAPSIRKKDLDISGSLLDALPPVIRAIRSAMRDARGAALTVPQFRVLGFVALQSCTNKQIAEWQGVSLPAMSRMVGSLVRRKLLVRAPDAADRRQVQLRLSTQGKEALERQRKVIETRLAGRIATLGKGEKEALAAALIALGELFSETS